LAMQSEQTDSLMAAEAVEYLPIWHCAQSYGPTVGLYVPAPHATHAPPSGPV